MKKINKWIIGAGTMTTIIAPLTVAVGCGGTSSSGSSKVSASVLASLKGIRGQGSSSVLPVMDELKKGLTDFQYEATGSGDGLKVGLGLITPAKDFGMTSSLKRPASGDVDKWINNRTLTWAVDAIGIMVNLPGNIKITNNDRPIINIDKLATLYDTDQNNQATWAELLDNEDTAASNAGALTSKPRATGRTGGKEASGTADGFWHTLFGYMGTLQKDENHVSLPNTTAEANTAAYNDLKDNAGTITYLSLGYAQVNQKEADEHNANRIKVAAIKATKDGATTVWNPVITNGTLDTSYKWTRPFNMIYNVKNSKALTFAKFLLSSGVQKKISDLNFVQLTKAQLDAQSDLTKTDLDILGGEANKAKLATDLLGLAV